MRIAFVTPLYHPARSGGTGLVVRQIAEGLVRRGHSCSVYCSNDVAGHWIAPFPQRLATGTEVIGGVEVRRLPMAWPLTAAAHVCRKAMDVFSLRAWPALRLAAYGPWLTGLKEHLRRDSFDVAHVEPFPYRLCWVTCRVCEELRRPFVLTPSLHEGADGYDNPLLFEAARRTARTVVFTNAEAESLERHGVPRERLVVKSPGIDLSERPAAPDARWPGKTVVLFAGTRWREKGYCDFVEAARLLQGRPDVIFAAIGPGPISPEALPGNFADLGFVPEEEKRALFARCDIFALPSRAESFGLVYAEAWRYGKPVIGADIPTTREVVRHNVTGLLTPFGDASALADALRWLIEDAGLRRRLGEAGREDLARRFDSAAYVDTMEAVYREVLNESHSTARSA